MIFDVDGTLADTECDGHRPAFNQAFAHHGLAVTWDPHEYGRLLQVAGGRDRVAGYLRDHGFGARSQEIADAVHRTKTDLFRRHVQSGAVPPRPGVPELVEGLVRTGVRIAVATTGRRAWVQPLVEQLLGKHVAEVMVTGDDVPRLKPDPAVYLLALRRLRLMPEHALAIEDSALGLRAARSAGLATVVVTNDYTAGQDFDGAATVLPTFDRPDALSATRCFAEHRRWWAATVPITARGPSTDRP